MFDIGFWELALVGLVALLVLGPERLPSFARTIGRWVGKAQRLTREFKRDLEREIDLSELRKLQQDLRQDVQVPELRELSQDLRHGADTFASELNQPMVFGPSPPLAAPTAPAPVAVGDHAPVAAAAGEPTAAQTAPPATSSGQSSTQASR